MFENPVGSEQIYRFFDEGGLLSSSFPGFEFREGQLEMALLCQRAFEEDAVAVIEAGTGIGKSFAYLAPALINSVKPETEERTVIATATKNLQLQLCNKDLPGLFDIAGTDCRTAVLFGRANYLCLRRLDDAMRDSGLFIDDPDSEIAKLFAFSQETETGLLEDLPYRVSPDLKNECRSDSDLCHGKKCPFLKECFYMKAKRQAQEARIIITNHHLLFTDAVSRTDDDIPYGQDAVLPAFSRLVIDEAHNIEDNATDLFSGIYSSYETLKTMSRILRPSAQRSKSLLEILTPLCKTQQADKRCLDCASDFSLAMGDLDLAVSLTLKEEKSQSLLIETPAHRVIVRLLGLMKACLKKGEEFLKTLTSFKAALQVPDEMEETVSEFTVLTERVRSSLDVLYEYANSVWTEDVHSIRMRRARNEEVFEFWLSPISVARKLSETVFTQVPTVICTSATLNLGDDFKFWESRVGLNLSPKKKYYLTQASPFDYEHNLMLLLPEDAPLYSKTDEPAFFEFAASLIKSAVESSGGGALILFTSYSMMDAVHNVLHEGFESMGMHTLKQGEMERKRLLTEFRNDSDSVLFATDSFWEGVDIPGDTLRLVIITKLPFPSPTEPIICARGRKIEREGGSSFFDLLLPEATMKLKQGFGRLIRNKTDKGIVLILDARVMRKGYGQFMINALPKSYTPETQVASIPDRIERFLF